MSVEDQNNTLGGENNDYDDVDQHNHTTTLEDMNSELVKNNTLVCQVMSDKGLPIHNKQSDMVVRKSTGEMRSSDSIKQNTATISGDAELISVPESR